MVTVWMTRARYCCGRGSQRPAQSGGQAVTDTAAKILDTLLLFFTLHLRLLGSSPYSRSCFAASRRTMRLLPFTLALVIQSVLAVTPAKRFYNTHDYYVLEHDPLAGASLAEVAGTLGVEVVEQAGELANHWLVRVAKGLEKRDADPVLRSLDGIRLEARSLHPPRSEHALRRRRVASSVRDVFPQTLRQRVKRAPPPVRPPKTETSSDVALRLGLHDPEFNRQWHLVNDEYPEHMMNVTALWEEGITGKGVITAFVDDGLDYTSEDLAANFVSVPSILSLPLLES